MSTLSEANQSDLAVPKRYFGLGAGPPKGRLSSRALACQARCSDDAAAHSARHGCPSSVPPSAAPPEPPSPGPASTQPVPTQLLPVEPERPGGPDPPPPPLAPTGLPLETPLTPIGWIPEDLDLPPLLFEPSPVHLLPRIPPATRLVASAVARQLCIAAVSQPATNNVVPWLLLLAFSRLVLRAPTRGGRRGRRQLSNLPYPLSASSSW